MRVLDSTAAVSFWNSNASSASMPRCLSSTRPTVHANVAARTKAALSAYFCTSGCNASRAGATTVQKQTRAVVPGAIVTRWRSENMGSRTAPDVFFKRWPPMTAIGDASVRPRPMKLARSVSNSRLPSSPSPVTIAAAQTGLSSGPRGRRCAKTAPNPSSYSVSTKSFENAGCAASPSAEPRTSSS